MNIDTITTSDMYSDIDNTYTFYVAVGAPFFIIQHWLSINRLEEDGTYKKLTIPVAPSEETISANISGYSNVSVPCIKVTIHHEDILSLKQDTEIRVEPKLFSISERIWCNFIRDCERTSSNLENTLAHLGDGSHSPLALINRALTPCSSQSGKIDYIHQVQAFTSIDEQHIEPMDRKRIGNLYRWNLDVKALGIPSRDMYNKSLRLPKSKVSDIMDKLQKGVITLDKDSAVWERDKWANIFEKLQLID